MKKSEMFIRVILFCFMLSLISYFIFENNEYKLYISAVCFIIPLYACIIISFIMKKRNNVENDNVTKASTTIKKVMEINKKYSFIKLYKKKHYIPSNINFNSYLDKDIDCIRSDIESSLYNISIYDKYIKDINEICDVDSIFNFNDETKILDDVVSSINEVGYSNKKFRKVERRVLSKLIYKKEKYIISLVDYDFDRLIEIYNEWLSNNKLSYSIINKNKYDGVYESVSSHKYIIDKKYFSKLTRL